MYDEPVFLHAAPGRKLLQGEKPQVGRGNNSHTGGRLRSFAMAPQKIVERENAFGVVLSLLLEQKSRKKAACFCKDTEGGVRSSPSSTPCGACASTPLINPCAHAK